MAKALLGLLAAFLATIGAARVAFELTRERTEGPIHEPWALGTMEYVAWNGEQWTAWIRDGSFEQTPQDTIDWHRHAKPSPFALGREERLEDLGRLFRV